MEHRCFPAIQAAYPQTHRRGALGGGLLPAKPGAGTSPPRRWRPGLYVSEASLSAFSAQKCGFKGYREFIYEYQRPFDEGSPFLLQPGDQGRAGPLPAAAGQQLPPGGRGTDAASPKCWPTQRVYIYGMAAPALPLRGCPAADAHRPAGGGHPDSHMIRMNAVLVDETVTVVAITLSGATEEVLSGACGRPAAAGPGWC